MFDTFVALFASGFDYWKVDDEEVSWIKI